MTTQIIRPAYSDFSPNSEADVISNSAFMGRVIQQTKLEWFDIVLKQIESFQNLKTGWDGYNAEAISLETVHFALNVISNSCPIGTPQPYIIPGPNSDLQFEWFFGDLEIELHVKGANNLVLYRCDSNNEEEINLTNNFTLIGLWLFEAMDGVNNFAVANNQ